MRPTHAITVWATMLLLISPASAADRPSGDADEPLPRGAFARLGTTRYRADERIAGLALSPDATRLAVADDAGDALLFDAATGRRLLRFEQRPNGYGAGNSPYMKMAFSRDGGLLAMADAQWLSLHDTTTGKLLALLPRNQHPYWDLILHFSKDGRSLLMFDHKKDNAYVVTVLDLATRRCVREIPVGTYVGRVTFSFDSKVMAVTYRSFTDGHSRPESDTPGSVRLLDLETGKTLRTIPTSIEATRMTFSPDGKMLAVKENAIITFWDVASGKRLQRFAALEGYSDTMTFSPDGKRFAALAGQGDIQVLATAMGKRIALHHVTGDPVEWSLAFTPEGDLIAVGCRGNTAWVWKPGKQPPPPTDGHQHSIHTLTFEDDGRRLVSTDTDSNTLGQCYGLIYSLGYGFTSTNHGSNRMEWNLTTGQARSRPETSGERTVGQEVYYDVAWGRQVGVGAIHVWDCATTRELARVPCNRCDRAQALPSPDGRCAAVSTRGNREKQPPKSDELLVWNLNTNKRVWRATAPDGWRETLQWSPGGTMLAAHAGGSTVELWDAGKGVIRRTLALAKDEHAGPMVFSPDGRMLYLAVIGPKGTHDIRRWDATTGEPVALPVEFRVASRVTTLALTPDGKTLASGHADGIILLWDLAGREKADLVVPPMKFAPPPVPPKPPAPSLSLRTGDSLPEGAVQRLGTTRFRLNDPVTAATISADGRVIAATATDPGWWRSIVLLDTAGGRPIRTLPKTGSFPTAMALSPDGKLLVHSGFDITSGEGGSRTEVVEVASGAVLYRTENTGVFPCFSADGQRHTAAGRDANKQPTLEVWDVKAKAKVQTFAKPFDGSVATSLSKDGNVLACWATEDWFRGAESPDVIVFDVTSGKRLRKITAGGGVLWAALSPDGKQVLVAEDGGALSVWDVATSRLRFRAIVFLPRSPKYYFQTSMFWHVAGLCYSPDGKRFAVWYDDVVEIRDAADGKPLSRRQGPEGEILSVVFVPDGDVRIVCAVEHVIYTIDRAYGRPPAAAAGPQLPVMDMVFSRDGKTLSAFGAGVHRDWNVVTGEPLAARRLDALQPLVYCKVPPVRDPDPVLHISPDGKYALVYASYGQPLSGTPYGRNAGLVDLERDQRLFDVLGFPCADATFAADGRNALTRVGKSDLYQWKLPSSQFRPFHPELFKDGANVLALAASRKVVAVLKESHQTKEEPPRFVCKVALRDTATGKETAQFQVSRAFNRVLFSPDETLLAFYGEDGAIDIWRADIGERYRTMALDKVHIDLLAISPDSHMLAAAVHEAEVDSLERGDCQIIIWELATGQIRRRFTSVDVKTTVLRFSPDGRILASAHRDTTIVLWDVFGAAPPVVEKATPAQLQAWWKDLADVDAGKGLTAMRQLAARPAAAAALIARNLPPGKALPAAERDRLIADLDHDDFQRREEASRRLRLAGHAVAPALRKALAAKPSVEQQRRLEELLERLARLEPNPETIRATRALEVLERIGTPEAKQVLEDLAKGDPNVPLTEDAKATLKRLARK